MAHLREFLRDYDKLVSDLRDFPNKETIFVATDIAGENIKHAQHVTGFLADKIARAPPSYKLPLLYLIDSIVKRVGGAYVSEFSTVVPAMFPEQYVLVSERDRAKFKHVLDTWEREQTFAPYLVAHLRRALHDADERMRARATWYPPPAPAAASGHDYAAKRQRVGHDGAYHRAERGHEYGHGAPPGPAWYPPVSAPAPAPYGGYPARSGSGYYAPPAADPRDVMPHSASRWGDTSMGEARDPRGPRPMPPRMAAPAPAPAPAHAMYRRTKRRRSRSRSRSQSPPRRPRSPLAGSRGGAPTDLRDLTGDASSVAKALYHNGPRCKACGARFKTEAEKEKHLGWHFEQKRAERQGSTMSARWWYVTGDEWIAGGAAERSKSIKVADLFGDTVAEDDAAEPLPEDSKVPVEEGVTTCDVCGDDLRKQYNGDSGEFEFVNAVKVRGRIIHATCQS